MNLKALTQSLEQCQSIIKNIQNYFDNRSTNAAAETFNTQIKAFRAQLRDVKNVEFFLFKLTNIFT